ncbi:hypothetical protein ACH5RR_019862 [Cinchona calisaya]|uniref:Uncharacterized protein n=1 Tax=Cinchona calisaya TaxID=153742 RepID=A0ABD2ZR13_9GENT
MICSISTSTSTSRRSTSNWLEKLRSSKGFSSSSTDLDLEQFLTHNNNNINIMPISPPTNLERSDSNPTKTEEGIIIENPRPEKQLFSCILSNVLAELFIMGGKIGPKKKKCSRKQTHPSLCLPLDPPSDFSTTTTNCGNALPLLSKKDGASPMSDDNSGFGLGKELGGDHHQLKLVENLNFAEEEEEKDKGFGNLSGFSRTEVTVIDTSFASWKFEKMLFRKKNVWKVRDKKGGKMMSSWKKKNKRKASIVDSGNVRSGIGEVKKPKILDGRCGLSKKGSEEAFKEGYYENNQSQPASRKISDTLGEALKQKQAILDSGNGCSSVVLIKNMPTGKKSEASIPRSCPKSTQRQLKV